MSDPVLVHRLKLVRNFDSLTGAVVRYLLLSLGILSTSALVIAAIIDLPVYIIALAILFLAPFILTLSWSAYINFLKTHPNYRLTPAEKLADPLNTFDFDALEAITALGSREGWRGFWQAITRNRYGAEVVYRLELTASLVKQLLDDTPVTVELLTDLKRQAVAAAEGRAVTVLDLIVAATTLPALSDYLTAQKLSDDDLDVLIKYFRGQLEGDKQPTNQRHGGFAKDWAISYTNLLDTVTTEAPMALVARSYRFPLYERQSIVDQIVGALTGASSRSALLTGPAGVGKSEIFYHLAARIVSYQTKTELDGLSVRLLDVQRLLSLAHTPAQLQQLLEALFAEIARAGNVILFIDQLDLLLSPNESVGSADLSAALVAGVEKSGVRLVGTASSEQYLELVKTNPELDRLLTQIEVPEPTTTELPGILLSQLRLIESRFQVFFGYPAIKELLTLSPRYLKDSASPLKEIRALEQVASAVHARAKTVVEASDVDQAIEQLAKVPITVGKDERQNLMNLEQALHRRVVGQDVAIKQVSDALLRARAGVTASTGPIGSFLFMGPTGVGKTETAKALAEIYFGSDDRLIRLDLTEYADDNSLGKLLGSDSKRNPGALALAIQQTPSAVLLLDEVEKSSPTIKNALMQLVDEGRLTTNYGQLLDFTNSMIIATSNAGSDFIRSEILAGRPVEGLTSQLTDQLINRKIFLTEFLNRFDGIAVFAPLTPEQIRQVVALQVNALKHRLFKEKGLTIDLSESVLDELATKGYDPVFGARALQRVIQNELETTIAKEIVSTNPRPGSRLKIERLST